MKPASALQRSHARAARDPDAWEQGCTTDKVRNEVVVPHLAGVLCSSRARSVLDLGSGTGYVTRTLARAPWAAGISWTLVDIDESLLRFALTSMSSSWAVATLVHDLAGAAPPSEIHGDVAFAVFTTLELQITPQLAKNLRAMLNPAGTLLLYLPDVLADVHATPAPKETLAAFLTGHAVLEKLDHFTNAHESFHATRLEQLLSVLLAGGLTLTRLEILPRSDREENIYCLAFQNASSTPSG